MEVMNRKELECGVGMRQSAKGVLEDKIMRIENKAIALRTLKKSIPWDILVPSDEELLWKLFVEMQ